MLTQAVLVTASAERDSALSESRWEMCELGALSPADKPIA
jgi:hypothetical protein